MRYNEHAIGEQAQIGRQLVVDNAKLMTAASAMSKVIINKDKENEKLTMEIKAYENKLGRTLTQEELDEFRYYGKFVMTTDEDRYNRLIEECI